MAPVATIVPCPGIRRGTEATVPIPPGLVSVMVAPLSSSGLTWPARVRLTRSSNESRKPRNPWAAASRTTGTRSERLPSLRSTSTARPRLTVSRTSLWGLPSMTWKPVPIEGSACAARMIAQATRCVNDSFSERPASLRSPLIWRRCASSAATPTVRKLVAVGIERLSSM